MPKQKGTHYQYKVFCNAPYREVNCYVRMGKHNHADIHAGQRAAEEHCAALWNTNVQMVTAEYRGQSTLPSHGNFEEV